MNLEKKDEILAKKISHILSYTTIIIQLTIVAFLLIGVSLLFYSSITEFFSTYNYRDFLESIFLSFLFLELIAAIKIYFQENFHFPIRFFVYLWITDLVRHLIISIESVEKVAVYTLCIIWLLFWLVILDKKEE